MQRFFKFLKKKNNVAISGSLFISYSLKNNTMKKVIFNILLFNFLIIPLFGQNFNEFSGINSGDGVIFSHQDYNTGFGDYIFTSEAMGYYNTAFGAYASRAKYSSVSLGYRGGDYLYYGVNIGVGIWNEDGSQKNVFIAHNILKSTTDDNRYNTFIGDEAGHSASYLRYSTFIGHQAGYHVVDAENIFIGHNAGYYTTVPGNTVIGNYAEGYGNGAAGYQLTTGEFNVLLGSSAGSVLHTASYCTFLGTGAGANTFGKDNNTFIGGLAGYNTGAMYTSGNATNNVLVGYKAGYTNIGGSDNVIVGYNADFSDTTYANNVMIGANTVASNDNITLIGYNATATADKGVGIGNEINVEGLQSIGIGYQTNMSGASDYSISLGYQASMTDKKSIGIGYLADIQNTKSTAIGSDITATAAKAIILGSSNSISGENAMALGYNISITNDNQINIGNDAVMSISGIVNWTTTSDGRLKTNVQEDIPGLDFIMKLRPVTYQLTVNGGRWTDASLDGIDTLFNAVHRQARNEQPSTVYRFTGFIAQEVEQTALSIGYDFSGIDANSKRYGLRYSQFTVPLVQAVQELSQSQLDNSKNIQRTNAKTVEIEDLLEKLNARLETLESE
jgi:hypothetical protein